MTDVYNFSRIKTGDVKEGGISRDFAFYNSIKNNSKLVKITNNKILNLLKIFIYFFTLKNKIIILHYPALGIPIFQEDLISTFLRTIYIYLYKKAMKNNQIYIDIADLPHEQALDMDRKGSKGFMVLEKVLFKCSKQLIFASDTMREYSIKKYNINTQNTIVCINGGSNLKNEIPIEKNDIFFNNTYINLVYAGTLNRGRQIEKMIDNLLNIPKTNLILMGTEGEWIDKKYGKDIKNLSYLGTLEESLAHIIVSKCDIGLIPYDENREYYNIAYPTKLSFYITAGIPFLSTNVKEVLKINKKSDLGFIEKIENWRSFIKKLKKEECEIKKKKIELKKEDFYWENIFKKIYF